MRGKNIERTIAEMHTADMLGWISLAVDRKISGCREKPLQDEREKCERDL